MPFNLFAPAARVPANIPAVEPATRHDLLVVRDTNTGAIYLYTDNLATVRVFVAGNTNPNLEVRRASVVLYRSRVTLDDTATEEAL